MQAWEKEIRDIEEDIEQLKMKLERIHIIRSQEQDYDIKSKIIAKQNELIEILIRENKKFLHLQKHN